MFKMTSQYPNRSRERVKDPGKPGGGGRTLREKTGRANIFLTYTEGGNPTVETEPNVCFHEWRDS